MGFFKSLVRIYLFFVGVLPNDKNTLKGKYLFYGLVTCNIILITGIIIGVIYSNESRYRTEALSHLFSVSFVLGIQCTSYANRDTLTTLSDKLCGYLDPDLKNNVTLEAEQKIKKTLRPFSIFFSFLIVSVTVPILRVIFQHKNVDYNNPDIYPVPYWFAHGNVTSLTEYLTIIISLNFLAMIDIVAFWCFTIFLICVVFTFRIHLNEINKRIKLNLTVDEETSKILMSDSKHCDNKDYDDFIKIYRPKFDEKKIKELRYLILYQQAFYSYIKVFIKYLRMPFSLMLVWFTFTTVLVTYASFQASGNVAFIVRITSQNANLLAAFFIYCNIAEITSHQGEILLNLFYKIPWYTMFPHQRKIFIVAMTHCHENFNIKAFGMYTINLNLHIRVLRIVFSMVNILLIFYKK